jgi:beta-1,2-mannobiose phosphorylase / 1,2-beta-oligomannan phosphorylase
LFHWKRLGLATFAEFQGIDFVHVDNKDASLFPVAIPNHAGKMQMAILHRPLFPGTRPEETACQAASRVVDLDHESIWISYCPMALDGLEPGHLGLFNSHHRLAAPVSPWERLKIGGGAPPILTRHGWLIVYHGVSEIERANYDEHQLCYSAGVMVLSKEHPQMIRYRSAEPVLTPVLPQECHGTVPHVVFPTGIDRRDDLGLPNRFDVYYGMADYRIGVARLDLPDVLPPEGVADPPEAKVYRKRLKAGDDVEQFFVDGFLSNPVQRAVQLFRNVFDVLFRALHGRQAAGVFTGKGFGARLKEQNEKVSSNESGKRRYGSFNHFRQNLRGPGHCG